MTVSEPIELRGFVAQDLPRLRAWLRNAGLGVPSRVDPAAWGRRLLGDRRILLRTATIAGEAVGFVRLDLAPDRTAELTLVVDPLRRRRGIGKRMLQSAITEARTRGLRRLIAVVAEANEIGLKFFSENDFEASGSAVPGFDHLERYVHRSDRQEPLEIVP